MNKTWVRLLWVGMVVLGIGALLKGCGLVGDSATYRYKLTLSVDTPDGVKTGFSVVEITREQYGQAWKMMSSGAERATGEALYLDLGPGRRPLIALLTFNQFLKGGPEATDGFMHPRPARGWGEQAPTSLLTALSGGSGERAKYSGDDIVDEVRRLQSIHDVFQLAPKELPNLVTFGDINDPKTVALVDPDNLEETLGPGMKWRSATIEVVSSQESSLTTGIKKRLPWVDDYNTAFYPTNVAGHPAGLLRLDFKR